LALPDVSRVVRKFTETTGTPRAYDVLVGRRAYGTFVNSLRIPGAPDLVAAALIEVSAAIAQG
jgi:hypothetical protein